MRRRVLAIAGVLVLALGVVVYVAARHVLASDAVRDEIVQQLSRYFGQPVRIGSADASVFPRVALDLQDITIGDPAAVHVAHLRVTTGLRALFSRTIADAEVELSGGRIVLPLPFDLAPSSPRGAGPARASAPLTISSIRVISLRDVALVAGARTLRLDLESSLAGSRLDVRSLTARADKTRITATGVLADLSRVEGHFDARADPLELDEMIAIGSAMTGDMRPAGARRSASPTSGTLHLGIELKAPKGHFAGYAFEGLSATVDVVPGRFSLSPLAVRTFGGTLNGSLVAATAGAAPVLRLDGRFDGMNMSEIMQASGSPGAVTGRLGGTMHVTAQGSDAASILQSAAGSIDASIANGELPHLDMVRRVVLAFGKPSGEAPAGSGTAFSRLGGSFALDHGVLTSNDLALASRDVDMHGRAAVRLASGELDARADVALSRELTAQAGTDLRRYAQEDGRVVVPALVGGTLGQPSISIDVAAASRRAIANELQRRAKDALEGLFKKKKGGG